MPITIDSVTLSRSSVLSVPDEVVRVTVAATSSEGRPLTIRVWSLEPRDGVFPVVRDGASPLSATFDWIVFGG